MSTRCNLIIKSGYRDNSRFILYHHHDGYPEGVGVQLKKVISKYQDWQIKQHGLNIATGLIKDNVGLNDKEREPALRLAGDIEYLYVLNCKSRTLRCFKVDYEDCGEKDIIKRSRIVDIPEWDGGKTIYE